MRLVDQRNVQWQNRAHFFGIAAQMMRRILVDHARTKKRVKRGGSDVKVSLADANIAVKGQDLDVVALDEALTDSPRSTSNRVESSSSVSSAG